MTTKQPSDLLKPQPCIHFHPLDFDVGGTERWTLTLGHGLEAKGCRLSVTDGLRLDADAQRLFRNWERFPLQAIPADALVVATCDIDALTRHHKRVVAVAHGMNGYYKGLMADGGYYKAVAVSQIARQAFPAATPSDVVYNGVDLDRLEPSRSRTEMRAELGIAPDTIVIGFVGRWSVGKRPLLAAQAAGALSNAVALYVGPYEKEPELVREAMATASCRFVAPEAARAIGDLYRAMDVCLVPSRTEGFSLVMAEAWACGVPVVSTPVGLALEHPQFVTGLPSEPTPSDAAAAISTALAPENSHRLEGARQLVQDRYTSAHMVDHWWAFLQTIA